MTPAPPRCRSFRQTMQITRVACWAGSQLSRASTRTGLRRRTTSRSKPICKCSKRGFQARATSTTHGRCTMPANPGGGRDTIYLAPSGKSPAYLHHRKNFESPCRETGCGLFHSSFPNRAAAAGPISSTRAPAARRLGALPSELHCAGARERADRRVLHKISRNYPRSLRSASTKICTK